MPPLGHGRAGPWALAPGRWVAGKEAGPFAGRHHCGQLCCVGASSLALCSLRAWSQTAPLFSCWDCWEVGRPDWGVWAGGRDARCQALTGPVSVLLQVRPGIKVQLGSGPRSLGPAVAAPLGALGCASAGRDAGARLHSHVAPGRLRALPPWLLLTRSPPLPGLGRSPALWPSCSLCSLFPPLCPAPAMLSGRLCPWSLLQASLPALSPAVCISLSLQLSSSPASVPPSLPPCLSPSAPVAPASLGSISKSLSGSPYLCLSWPGLHVPVSLGACVWVGMGVSLEKSLLASPLQLQAGCHGNRVRGPPRCNS